MPTENKRIKKKVSCWKGRSINIQHIPTHRKESSTQNSKNYKYSIKNLKDFYSFLTLKSIEKNLSSTSLPPYHGIEVSCFHLGNYYFCLL